MLPFRFTLTTPTETKKGICYGETSTTAGYAVIARHALKAVHVGNDSWLGATQGDGVSLHLAPATIVETIETYNGFMVVAIVPSDGSKFLVNTFTFYTEDDDTACDFAADVSLVHTREDARTILDYYNLKESI